jgi:hypothetical protein
MFGKIAQKIIVSAVTSFAKANTKQLAAAGAGAVAVTGVSIYRGHKAAKAAEARLRNIETDVAEVAREATRALRAAGTACDSAAEALAGAKALGTVAEGASEVAVRAHTLASAASADAIRLNEWKATLADKLTSDMVAFNDRIEAVEEVQPRLDVLIQMLEAAATPAEVMTTTTTAAA